MNRELQIWDFVHYVKTGLTREEQYSLRFVVAGRDNYYLVSYHDSNNGVVRFRIEKNYRLAGNPFYKVSDISKTLVGDNRSSYSIDSIEVLYTSLIPYIRQLKLDSLGI